MSTKTKGKVKSLIEYFLILLLKRVLSLLPSICFYRFASLFASLLIYIFPSSSSKDLINRFKIAFGNSKSAKELSRLKREVFVNAVYSFFEFLMFPSWSREYLETRFSFEPDSLSLVKSLIAKGQGMVLVSAHYGNWELMGKAIASLGFPVNVIYRPFDNSYIDKYVNDKRSFYPLKLILREEAYHKGIRALRNNEILILLIDQHQAINGIYVSFFGRKVLSAQGASVLSYRTRSPMVFSWIERNIDKSKHTVYFEEINLCYNLEFKEFIYKSTQDFTYLLENIIKRNPSEWWWFHERWRDN